MAKARRTANLVRKEILEGFYDYAEGKADMAAAADVRRSEEFRRRNEDRCGTICCDIPNEWLQRTTKRFFTATTDRSVQAAMLN